MDAPAEIGLDHGRVGHDGRGVAVRDDAAGIHADQPLGDLQQHVDDVLDPDDRDRARRATRGSRRRVRPPPRRSGRRRSRRAAAPSGWWRAPAPARGACGRAGRASRRGGWRCRACRRGAGHRSRGRRRWSRAKPPPFVAATKAFSKTVMPLKGRGTWWVRTRPRRARSEAGRAVTSSPRKRIVPLVGACAPTSTLSSVVLPAPFGPTMPTASLPRDREIDPVEHHERVEPLLDRGCDRMGAPDTSLISG